ncbi:MAG: transposase [Gammaproteobacteria bacterium]|nr:transposase [Gammaproteobacteria bacterium]
MLAGATLHADDTPVPVLEPGRGRTKTVRLWTYVRDERPAKGEAAPAVWFAYSPDRKGVHPQQHLKTFRGTLHADGYAGFGQLFVNQEITESACWAHARRKLYEVHQAQASPLAATALTHPHRRVVCDRGRDSWSPTRSASRGPSGTGCPGTRCLARLAGKYPSTSLTQIGACRGGALRAGSLAGIDPLLR